MHALVVEPADYQALKPRIQALLPQARALATLPILLLDDAGTADAALAALPGVRCLPLDAEVPGLVSALDRAGRICLGYDRDFSVGGVSDPAKYPVVYSEPVGSLAPTAVCAAVNLSQTPSRDNVAPSDLLSIVNQSTRALSAFTVPVVAAGNNHTPGAVYETVSPWAEPDWVLSVGATTDAAGITEWERSARGSARSPGVGPDLLAWGQSGISDDPDDFGTSFAAPRVSFLIGLVRAWLLQVLANVDRSLGQPFGVPLVGVVVVDRGAALLPNRHQGGPEFDALPVLGTSPESLERLPAGVLRQIGEAIAWPAGPALSQQLLVQAVSHPAAARPDLSAPFADTAAVLSHLDAFTIGDLLNLLELQPSDGYPLKANVFHPGTAGRLRDLVEASMPIWCIDIEGAAPFVSFYRWATFQGAAQ